MVQLRVVHLVEIIILQYLYHNIVMLIQLHSQVMLYHLTGMRVIQVIQQIVIEVCHLAIVIYRGLFGKLMLQVII